MDTAPGNLPPKSPDAKLATTTITNRIIDAMAAGSTLHLPDGTLASVKSLVLVCKVVGPQTGQDGSTTWSGQYDAKAIALQCAPGPYTADLTIDSIGGVSAKDDVTLLNLTDITGGSPLVAGQYVCALWVGYDFAGGLLGLVLCSPNTFFPVTVVRNGGIDGSSSTYATYSYDIYPLGDATYSFTLSAAPIQPLRSAARTQVGSIQPASSSSVASAFASSSGVIQLWDCQELRSPPEVCTP